MPTRRVSNFIDASKASGYGWLIVDSEDEDSNENYDNMNFGGKTHIAVGNGKISYKVPGLEGFPTLEGTHPIQKIGFVDATGIESSHNSYTGSVVTDKLSLLFKTVGSDKTSAFILEKIIAGGKDYYRAGVKLEGAETNWTEIHRDTYNLLIIPIINEIPPDNIVSSSTRRRRNSTRRGRKNMTRRRRNSTRRGRKNMTRRRR